MSGTFPRNTKRVLHSAPARQTDAKVVASRGIFSSVATTKPLSRPQPSSSQCETPCSPTQSSRSLSVLSPSLTELTSPSTANATPQLPDNPGARIDEFFEEQLERELFKMRLSQNI